MNHFMIFKGKNSDESGEIVTTELALEIESETNPLGCPVRVIRRPDGTRATVVVVPARLIKELISAADVTKVILAQNDQYNPSEPIYGHKGDEPSEDVSVPAYINGNPTGFQRDITKKLS